MVLAAFFFAMPSWAGSPRPSEVLIGTEVIPLTEITLVPIPFDPSGTYRIEIGGAEVFLKIVPNDNGWTVTRAYIDPGLQLIEAHYAVTRHNDILVDELGTIMLRWGLDGVLVHETESGEEPPSLYWLYYAPE